MQESINVPEKFPVSFSHFFNDPLKPQNCVFFLTCLNTQNENNMLSQIF